MNVGAIHRARSADWGLPPSWVAWVHELLGGIALDPCSSHAHNARIQARRYFTAEMDALSPACDWDATLWGVEGGLYVNPPGAALWGAFWDRRRSGMGVLTRELWVMFSPAEIFTRVAIEERGGWLVIPQPMPGRGPTSARVQFTRSDGTRNPAGANTPTWFWTTEPPARIPPAPNPLRFIEL